MLVRSQHFGSRGRRRENRKQKLLEIEIILLSEFPKARDRNCTVEILDDLRNGNTGDFFYTSLIIQSLWHWDPPSRSRILLLWKSGPFGLHWSIDTRMDIRMDIRMYILECRIWIALSDWLYLTEPSPLDERFMSPGVWESLQRRELFWLKISKTSFKHRREAH